MQQGDPRVLMVSHRLLRPTVSFASAYEFEDVVCSIDDVDLVEIEAAPPKPLRAAQKLLSRLRKHAGIEIQHQPRRQKVRVTKPYDLFFIRVMTPRQLDILESIEGWQENCGVRVCWIDELWPHWVNYDKSLQPLQQFDHVFVGLAPTPEPLSAAIDRPSSFLSPAIDTLRFCPYPDPPTRFIDFYAMGSRSPVMHEELLAYARDRRNFTYLYDSALPTTFVAGPADHRELTASLVKRSRYFLTDRAKANAPEQTGGAHAFGPRFFEGAAGGAVLVGEPPKCATFDAYFDWPDAVVPIEHGSPGIVEVIEELDADPDRVHRASRANITNMLRRHDWTHRWLTALETVGLAPRTAAMERLAALERLAQEVESAAGHGIAV